MEAELPEPPPPITPRPQPTPEEQARGMAALLSQQDAAFDTYAWPQELVETPRHYYDVQTCAVLEWAGDLSDARLDRLLQGQETVDGTTWEQIALALAATGRPRVLEVALHIARSTAPLEAWPTAFRLLAQIEDERVENFFIEYLVHDEGLRPHLTWIVDDYFRDQ